MALPTVTTQAVSEIAPTTAKANGTIAATGNGNCSKRGFVYSLSSHGDPGNVLPGVSGYEFYAQDAGSFSYGSFDIELSALAKNDQYFVRAFAKNAFGYSYGDEVNFTTLENIYPDSIYSPRTKINKAGVNYDSAETTKLYSPDVTKLDDEVVSIETELGLLPKATSASVRERLKGIRSLSDAAADVLVVKGSNVGIGTTSPGSIFEVNGTGGQIIKTTGLTKGNITANLWIADDEGYSKISLADRQDLASANVGSLFMDGNSNLALWYEGNFALTFGTNSLERVRIISSGNVGIGTTIPTAKLDVNSDIIRLRTAKTPATAGAAGNAGDICWDSGFIYICVDTNSWKKVAIAAW